MSLDLIESRSINLYFPLVPPRTYRTWDKVGPKEVQKKGVLYWTLVKHFRRQIFKGYFLFFIADMCKLGSMITLRYVVESLESEHWDETRQTGWILMVLAVVLILINGVMATNSNRLALVTELRIKTILAAIIYRKVLRLNNGAFNETSSGHMISLLSADIEVFNMGIMFMYSWFFTPLMLLAIFIFEGFDIGPSILVAVGLLGLILLVQYRWGNGAGKLRYEQTKWTDRRVLLLNEIIKAMQVIKMYCWEKPYAAVANGLRRAEMSIQLKRSILVTLGISSGFPSLKLIVFLVTVCYILTGNNLTVGQSLSLIGNLKLLEISFFTYTCPSFILSEEMIASSERIKAFLLKEENANDEETCSSVEVIMKDVGAMWPVTEEDGKQFALKDININAEKGDLLAVVGQVGSGKSALLMACMKEMHVLKGSCRVNGRMAYAPQEPWILPDTMRENILFGNKFDKDRYNQVIQVCALQEDLERFPAGDQTRVGERGLMLSGGQKARISLARAVYEEADIYLLDDPLSAVDGKVANKIFFECINGFLKNKLRILATHQIHFLSKAHRVIVLEKGRMIAGGEYRDIADVVHRHTDIETKDTVSQLSTPLFSTEDTLPQIENSDKFSGNQSSKTISNVFGTVSIRVYLDFLKAGRGWWCFLPLFLFLNTIALGSGILHDWFLVSWKGEHGMNKTIAHEEDNVILKLINPTGKVLGDTWYLEVLAVLLLVSFGTYMLAYLTIAYMYKTAGEGLYQRMFERLLKAPMHFFETNPVGTIVNRFSRDTAFMDIYMLVPLLESIKVFFPCIVEMIYVFAINAWCMIPAAIYIIALVIISRLLLPGIRETKRIEATLRSPLYTHLSATLDGKAVIRCMRREDQFLQKAYNYIDHQSSAWFYYIGAQRSLSFAVDILSAVLISLAYIILLWDFDEVHHDHRTVGLAFMYLPGTIMRVSVICIHAAQVEAVMTSIERIQQYSKIAQEDLDHRQYRPKPNWPHQGNIDLKNVRLHYGKQPALGPLNINIKPGEKIGVVGRTGAGKSSLVKCLMRLVEPTGRVIIDGVNISDIGLLDLRGCISVIPQDPVLFSRSLRYNMDPFDNYKDEDLWQALKRVELKAKVLELPGQLMAEMGESGSNFSVGEKQLLCLARAIMRKNKIVLVDEATANVDNRTDAIIQLTLKEALEGATVITIAHRLKTLLDMDRIMVLEKGQLVEMDHPYHLLESRKGGTFRAMVSALGGENVQYFRKATSERLLEKNGMISTSL